jgi:SAM-dependent methyltransferase
MPSARELLQNACFPRSSGYDPQWILDGRMGPNPLWLTEWLTGALELQPGQRVLDLGCGQALSSVFLAREYDVQVVAADLWTSVDDNWQRIMQAGAQQRVTPIHAEAHALPFAAEFFDAIVSVDAYQYFGTDVLYLHYLSRFLRPDGMLGVVMPGLTQPLPPTGVPEHLTKPQSHGQAFWEPECVCFHTAAWWQELFGQCPTMRVTQADTLQDGWRHWRDYDLAAQQAGDDRLQTDVETLTEDAGRYIGFVRVVAQRQAGFGHNLYDPALHTKFEAQR